MRNIIFLVLFLSAIISNILYGQPASTPQTTTAPAAQTQQVQPEQQKKEPSNYYNDPFSEVDASEDEEYEEALDRFYTFGRILHLSAYGQMINIRGPMSDIYKSGAMGGVRVSYFIDWDVAVTFHFSIGKTSVSIINPNPLTAATVSTITGSATMANVGLGIKYYINFYDIAKPIAYINPAISAGAELNIMRDSIDADILKLVPTMVDPAHRTVAPGLFAGVSIEFPIFRKSIYLGGEFIYHFSFFPASNPNVAVGDPHFGTLDYSGNYMTFGASLIWNI